MIENVDQGVRASRYRRVEGEIAMHTDDHLCRSAGKMRPLDRLAALIEAIERKQGTNDPCDARREELGSVLATVSRQATFIDNPPLIKEAGKNEREAREKSSAG